MGLLYLIYIYMELAGHVACMGERRCANSDLVCKTAGKRPSGKKIQGEIKNGSSGKRNEEWVRIGLD
jgi:hypothetical protein